MSHWLIGCAVAAAMFTAGPSLAQSWPSGTVTIVVPFGAGGGVDVTARALAANLEPIVGQSVIVENRTGAGGVTGHATGAAAAPDGQTLTLVTPSIGTAPLLIDDVPVTPEDFAYIGQVSVSALIMVVSADSEYQSVDDVVEAAKADPGQMATPWMATWPTPTSATAMLVADTGIEVRQVPGFSGGAEMLQALLGGHVDFSINNVSEVLPQLEAGTMRALAVTSTERIAELPDVPTFAELGYGVEIGVWRTLAAPKETPDEIVAAIDEALREAIARPELVEDFKAIDLAVDHLGPEESTAVILDEYERMSELVSKFAPADE
jgi:tripartite-type tricarboxylate transporter receptor subunit TctC